MSETMTANRFCKCLALLHWSERDLAKNLYCDDRLVRRWAQGSELVPASIVQWLEELTITRESSPGLGWR